jgi:hypothetical protein
MLRLVNGESGTGPRTEPDMRFCATCGPQFYAAGSPKLWSGFVQKSICGGEYRLKFKYFTIYDDPEIGLDHTEYGTVDPVHGLV